LAAQRLLFKQRERLAAIACRAEALSPLAVLARGYSVTTDEASGEVLTKAEATAIGGRIRTRLAAGALVSRVEGIEREDS
jgi:exodeoxyribonuclease VII large subunit